MKTVCADVTPHSRYYSIKNSILNHSGAKGSCKGLCICIVISQIVVCLQGFGCMKYTPQHILRTKIVLSGVFCGPLEMLSSIFIKGTAEMNKVFKKGIYNMIPMFQHQEHLCDENRQCPAFIVYGLVSVCLNIFKHFLWPYTAVAFDIRIVHVAYTSPLWWHTRCWGDS